MEEQSLLDLAIGRGWLTEGDIQRATREANRQTEPDGERWGPRVDVLIRLGILEDDAVATLARELESIGSAETQAADSPAIGGSPGESRRPERVGRYQILRLLGAGGAGRVYLALDPQLRRQVALKLLHPYMPEALRLTLAEARLQASVEHDAVCKVYEVGEAEGRPYIALQLVEGVSLAAAAAGMTREEKLTVVRAVAAGVHEAHRKGLVHRDLKPSNILVERGERGPRAFVTDFGLARAVDAAHTTATGGWRGTPHYMAPEQARGDRAVDRRADVYALGATLYELFVGRPPFDGTSSAGVLIRVIHDEPIAPRRAAPGISVDLEAVILRCLEKDPAQRYPSAADLAEELRRLLEGEPVLTRRPSRARRALRRLRRHPGLAAMAAVAMAALVVAGAVEVRARAETERQATLARRMGESMEEMETMMRIAYMAPLHDVSRERDAVRARMAFISKTARALGAAGVGPGHYARGRAHLALGEPQQARAELEAAWASGYRTPEVALWLGSALAACYRKTLVDLWQIADEGARRARAAAAARELRDPALRYLRAGRGANPEPALLVEATIAHLDGHDDEAIAVARRAFADSPWLFEARLLEGDILVAQAGALFDRGEGKAAAARLEEAAAPYRDALAVGRSAPAVLVAECHRRWNALDALGYRTFPSADVLADASHACANALVADPNSLTALRDDAQLHALLADEAIRRGADPRPALNAVLASLGRATRIAPGDADAQQDLGVAALLRGQWERRRDLDPTRSLERAVRAFQAALAVEPRSIRALNNEGIAYRLQASWQLRQGLDPRPELWRALERYVRAGEVRPGYHGQRNNEGRVYALVATYELDHGLDASRAIARALAAYLRAAEDRDPAIFNNLGDAYALRALYELRRGRDPRASSASAIAAFAAALGGNPRYSFPLRDRGDTWLTMAAGAQAAGQDPRAALARARASCAAAVSLEPRYAGALVCIAKSWLAEARADGARDRRSHVALARARKALARAIASDAASEEAYACLAEVDLMAARWRRARHLSARAQLDAAAAALSEAPRRRPAAPALAVLEARVHELRAEEQLAAGETRAARLQLGLGEAALAGEPPTAKVLVHHATLHFLWARASADPVARALHTAAGSALLNRARSLNPAISLDAT